MADLAARISVGTLTDGPTEIEVGCTGTLTDEALWGLAEQVAADNGYTGAEGEGISVVRYSSAVVPNPTP